MKKSLAGQLLVATPALLDPNFRGSVVLICEHNDEGALGVILNRPLEAELGEHLPDWQHLASDPPQIFEGGPVQREVALAVGRHTPGEVGSDWTPVTDEIGLLDLDSEPADLWGELQELRVFSGYAGWSTEQLEGELDQQAWFVVDAERDDPFSADPGDLWERVLRRQGGSLSTFADFPDDPPLN